MPEGRAGKRGGKHVPDKRTLNLYVPERRENLKPAILLSGLFCLLLLLLVGKFEIADRLTALRTAEQELAEIQEETALVRLELQAYDTVRREYLLYSDAAPEGGEKTADRMAVLDLLEKHLLYGAAVTDLTVRGNEITVHIAGTDLDALAALTEALQGEALVSGITVDSAVSAEGEGLLAGLRIHLTGEEERDEYGNISPQAAPSDGGGPAPAPGGLSSGLSHSPAAENGEAAAAERGSPGRTGGMSAAAGRAGAHGA